MSVLTLPGMVACTGAVVVASENSNPEAPLTLVLRTEAGEECLLTISETAARQFTRSFPNSIGLDFLFNERQAAARQRFSRG